MNERPPIVLKPYSRTAPPTNTHSDDYLLARAYTQWEFGDWTALADTPLDTQRSDTDQALLALLCGAAHLQLEKIEEGKRLIRFALENGCSYDTAVLILISGVHNSLGRSASINGDKEKARAQYQLSIELSPFQTDPRLMAIAREGEQSEQIAKTLTIANEHNKKLNTGVLDEQTSFPIKRLKSFNLGEGWSSNTVNTVIFRHHGILSRDGYQYTAFYVNEKTLRVVQRTLDSDILTSHDLIGTYNLRDAHNSISLGIDCRGHLHISYDHHATRLRYRRSNKPHVIDNWTEELPMTGVNEERVTYPTFILPRANNPLTLLYRDGVHNKGTARLKVYDEEGSCWKDRPVPILSGSDHKPWTSNAYWNHPAIGSDGSLHLSFVWRTDTLGENRLVNNVNICYAWSPDNGLNWYTSRGQPCKLPITQVNAETVWSVSPGSNLINQTSMALDSHNRPHIVFYANDTHGVPQYQHIWFDGEGWNQQYFSRRTQPFLLQGGGTLQIPISRPEILIDRHDRVYAIYRGDLTDNYMVATLLMNVASGEKREDKQHQTTRLWHEQVDYAEPVIDRTRWCEYQDLSLLLQRNQQPNGDRSHQETSDPVWLVDFSVEAPLSKKTEA